MPDAPQWTPEAALAFIDARPSDKDADAIIRSLAAALLAVGERDRQQIARLTEALERIADRGCRVRYGGRRRDWTCLDQQRDAIERPEGYANNDYWRSLKAGDRLCDACTARAVLAGEEDARP